MKETILSGPGLAVKALTMKKSIFNQLQHSNAQTADVLGYVYVAPAPNRVQSAKYFLIFRDGTEIFKKAIASSVAGASQIFLV
jgi:hypothetical protein